MKTHTPWLSIRSPLSPVRATGLKICAFLLPLAAWCVVSYVPAVWQPMMRITVSGGSGVRVGSYMDRHEFAEMNQLLAENEEKPIGPTPSGCRPRTRWRGRCTPPSPRRR
jgi:NitT/TauT family transport system permease protein